MEILKSNSKLKNTSVEDVAYKDRPMNKHFFNGKSDKVDNVAFKKDAELVEQGYKRTLTDSQAYNANIRNIDTRYSKLTPLASYIVRICVAEDKELSSGIILPTMMSTRKQTNSGILGDKIPDPFKFTAKAVIVALPEYEKELKVGDLVQIVRPRTIVDGDSIAGYEYEYIHPDNNAVQAPSNIKDIDFGYAIIPRNMIKVIINE